MRNRVINPLVWALLRSPAHRVMSHGMLLLTYTGRRSGRRYTLPVQYVRADHGLGVAWVGRAVVGGDAHLAAGHA